MTTSVLKQFVLAPIVLSGSIFCTLTLPLALRGSEPIKVQLQEEPIFYGKLKDLAAPYLGLATIFSFGIAVATISVTGWRQSNRQTHQIKEKLSTLQQELKLKESQLNNLKFSQSNLKVAGLDSFLDDEVATSQPLTPTEATSMTPLVNEVSPKPTPTSSTAPQGFIVETGIPVTQPLIIAPQSSTPNLQPLHKTVASLPAAQISLGFIRTRAKNSICISGTVCNNLVTGKALESTYSEPEPITLNSNFQGSKLVNLMVKGEHSLLCLVNERLTLFPDKSLERVLSTQH